MPTFKDAKTGAAITVKVTPRGKRNEILGMMEDGTLKVRVAAVPEDGAANRMLVEYLAEFFGLPAGQIELVAGLSSERKLISLIGITPAEVEAKVKAQTTARPKRARASATPTRKGPAAKRPVKKK